MVCRNLDKDVDVSCTNFTKKFVQRVILVNKSSVARSQIYSTNAQNRVLFKLKNQKRGFAYIANENGGQISGSFSKSEVGNIPQYNHEVNILVMGNDENAMTTFNQLDNSNFFAALLTYDGDVLIYGVRYGLSTGGYKYDSANGNGGAIIRLSSDSNALEDEPPLVYKSQNNTPIVDFENAFEDVIFEMLGDFNDDFNIDFNNG